MIRSCGRGLTSLRIEADVVGPVADLAELEASIKQETSRQMILALVPEKPDYSFSELMARKADVVVQRDALAKVVWASRQLWGQEANSWSPLAS